MTSSCSTRGRESSSSRSDGSRGTLDRAALGREVDRLHREHDRDGFVAAVRELANRLTPAERDMLGAVLLERARALEDVIEERSRAQGWLGRLWERPPRPPAPP